MFSLHKLLSCIGLVGIFFLGIVLAGCAGTSNTDQPVEVDVDVVTTEGFAGGEPVANSDVIASGINNEQDTYEQNIDAVVEERYISSSVPKGDQTIYFQYDSSTLSSIGRNAVNMHVARMKAKPELRLILEGHADERGTREYNLALAEERTLVIRKLVRSLGIAAIRIETISYGEERPVVFGNDEASWSQNRRVEFLYQ